MTRPRTVQPRWQRRLTLELAHSREFEGLDELQWEMLLRKRRVTSVNHDTVLALDWPHFCGHATEACGGRAGWCYTFQGNQANRLHNRHVAMVDALARSFPHLFGAAVAREVHEAVHDKRLPYANLRYSGSGEVVEAYIPALRQVCERGVHLWGFTRSVNMANALRELGAGVIFSCDRTTPVADLSTATMQGFPLGYTSADVNDRPPAGTVVTFPVHRVGRVREVVDCSSICPKVLADFLHDCRPPASCQQVCQRCHRPESPNAIR
jgi:hypothetical protein